MVQFSGDVELRPRQASQQLYLRTDSLSVDTDKNLAYSNGSPVEVRFGSYFMTATSFEADLRKERVRLQGIRGRSATAPIRTSRRE